MSDGVFVPGVSRSCAIYGDRECCQEFSAIAEAAGSCLPGVPKHVTAFVWRDWLNGFCKLHDDTLWLFAVFELAWRRISGSSLKAETFVDVCGCRVSLDAIPQLRANLDSGMSSPSEMDSELAKLPDDPPQWYSLLDDVLNASIAAIDLLFAIADQESAPATSQQQSGKKDGGASSTPTAAAEAAKPLQEGQILAFRAAEYARAKTQNPKLRARQVWEFWTDPNRGLAKEDRDEFPELVGYDPGNYSTFAPQLSRATNHPLIDEVCYGGAKGKESGGSVVRSKDV